jgi:hypothetical protein
MEGRGTKGERENGQAGTTASLCAGAASPSPGQPGERAGAGGERVRRRASAEESECGGAGRAVRERMPGSGVWIGASGCPNVRIISLSLLI